MKPIALVTANVRLRKSESGRIGSLRAVFRQDEGRQEDHGERDQRQDLPRVPGPRRPAEAREEDDRGQCPGEEARRPGSRSRARGARCGYGMHGDHGERDGADRKVDVEDPPPGELVDEEAAEERPDDRRHAEDAPEEALVAAAISRRDDVADDGERHDHQSAGAEALERTERDQLAHVLRQPAERRPGEEDHDRRLQHLLAAVEVAELPVQRAGDRRRQQVRRDDPRQVLEAAELAHDRRQRGGDDRLVERREQQDQQERGEDQPYARLL